MDRANALERYPDTRLVNVLLTKEHMPQQLIADVDEPLINVFSGFAGAVSADGDKTTVEIDRDGEKAKAQTPRKTGEFLSLLPYWSGGPDLLRKLLDGYRLVVHRTVASSFRQLRAIVAKNSGRGYYIEELPDFDLVINARAMVLACYDALSAGGLERREGIQNASGPFVRYALKPGIGIVSYQLRLDHALTLLKVLGKDSDVYGDRVLGAMPYHSDMKTRSRKWKIVYGVGADGRVPEGMTASVDHVKAKAAGGPDHLVNMQLMRKDRNTAKGMEAVDKLPDPKNTMGVLDVLVDGVSKAAGEGKLAQADFNEIMRIAQGEYKACEKAATTLSHGYSKQAKKARKAAKRAAAAISEHID